MRQPGPRRDREPDTSEFSFTTVTACANADCEQATYSTVSSTDASNWLLVLGPCIEVDITNDIDSAVAKFVAIEPTGPACTWFPVKLGDVVSLSVMDSAGTVRFDKTHTITTQGDDSCGSPCFRLALKF
jgi:hypothetical protein